MWIHYRSRVRGFIDPATLITLGVLLVAIVGSIVATQVVHQSSKSRSSVTTSA